MIPTRRPTRQRLLPLLAAAGVLLVSGCVIVNRVVERTSDRQLSAARSHRFKHVTKAHLADGSLVVFPKGFRVDHGQLVGGGLRYDLARRPVGPVASLALDSVVFLQHYLGRRDNDAFWVSTPPLVAAGLLLVAGVVLSPVLPSNECAPCLWLLPSVYSPFRDSILHSRESPGEGPARPVGLSPAREKK